MERFVDEIFINSDGKALQVKLYKQDCCKKCIYYSRNCDYDPEIPKCTYIDRHDHNDVYFRYLDLF